jgi:hypothetical protein
MADVERGWFRKVMAGREATPHYSSKAEPEGDFDGATPTPEVVADAWKVWRQAVAFADQFVSEAPDLEVTGHER